MEITKRAVILALLMMLTPCVLNVAAVSSMSMTSSQSWWSSTCHYHFRPFLPDGQYAQNDYPPEVTVGQDFVIRGRLMQNDTAGVPKVGFTGPDSLYHSEIIGNVPYPTVWKVKTNAIGDFFDTFHFDTPGKHIIYYVYVTANNEVYTSDSITIYAVPA